MQTNTTYTKSAHRLNGQDGSALPISLIILLMLTILGVSNMETTIREEKMAGNSIDRQKAFQAAEAALRDGERTIQKNTSNIAKVVFYNNGVDDSNITQNNDGDTCTNGFCLPRQYTQGFSSSTAQQDAKDCTDSQFIPDRWYNCPSGTSAASHNLNVWNDGSGRYISYSIANTMNLAKDPRYIIEFMRYAPTPGGTTNCTDSNSDGIPDAPYDVWPFCPTDPQLFRITALGYGGSVNTRVMLQSTYLKTN